MADGDPDGNGWTDVFVMSSVRNGKASYKTQITTSGYIRDEWFSYIGWLPVYRDNEAGVYSPDGRLAGFTSTLYVRYQFKWYLLDVTWYFVDLNDSKRPILDYPYFYHLEWIEDWNSWDTLPPQTKIDSLPTNSYHETFDLKINPIDPINSGYIRKSGTVWKTEFQVKFENGDWQSLTPISKIQTQTNPWLYKYTFSSNSLGQATIRSRSIDEAGNVQPWPEDSGEWRTISLDRGVIDFQITDPRGAPLSDATVTFESPEAEPMSIGLDSNGHFSGGVNAHGQALLRANHPSYADSLPLSLYIDGSTSEKIVMRPVENWIADGEFENGIGSWQTTASSPLSVRTIDYFPHSGGADLLLGPEDPEPALSLQELPSPSYKLYDMYINSYGGVHMFYDLYNSGPYNAWYRYRTPEGVWQPDELIRTYKMFTYNTYKQYVSPTGEAWVVFGDQIPVLVYHKGMNQPWQGPVPTDSKLCYDKTWLFVSRAGDMYLFSGNFVQVFHPDLSAEPARYLLPGFTPPSTCGSDIKFYSYSIRHIYEDDNGDVVLIYYGPELTGPSSSTVFHKAILSQKGTVSSWTTIGIPDIHGLEYQRDSVGTQRFITKNSVISLDEDDDMIHEISFPGGEYDYFRSAEDSLGQIQIFEELLNTYQFAIFRNGRGIWSSSKEVNPTYTYKKLSNLHISEDSSAQIIQINEADPIDRRIKFYSRQRAELDQTALAEQSFTVPWDAMKPTLSFFYELEHAWGGTNFEVAVTGAGGKQVVFTSNQNTLWKHIWVDLSPWIGQEIKVSFQLNQVADTPLAAVRIDEVSAANYQQTHITSFEPQIWDGMGSLWVDVFGDGFSRYAQWDTGLLVPTDFIWIDENHVRFRFDGITTIGSAIIKIKNPTGIGAAANAPLVISRPQLIPFILR